MSGNWSGITYTVRVTYRKFPGCKYQLANGNTGFLHISELAVRYAGTLDNKEATPEEQEAYLRAEIIRQADKEAASLGSPGWTTATVEGMRQYQQWRRRSKAIPSSLKFKMMNRSRK
jgi:predicted RNA-binding protein with RPS1 domain